MLGPFSAGASPLATPSHALRATHLQARFDVGIHRSVTPAQLARANAATAKLKTFSASVIDPVNSQSYKYSMVGTNPEIKGTTNSTAVTTQLVPLVIKYPAG